MRALGFIVSICALSAACGRSENAPPVNAEPAAAAPVAVAAAVSAPMKEAAIGQPAPDFTLTDLDGHSVKLSENLGKIVVLEWFNPGCPFVNLSHTKGQLKGLANEQMKQGVVWLGINSAGPGKEGYGKEANAEGKKHFGLDQPILLDESGKVGHAYGAKHTPHLFIIDSKGILVYAGAIDNSPDGEGESPTSGALVNYVTQALGDVRAGRAVQVPSTEAYGCSVKYGS
jgi:peroxiredoxin